MHHYCTKVSARGTANYNLFVERVNQHLVEVSATGWKLIDTNWAARDTVKRPGSDGNAVNFGVVAVQRFYGGKVVAVVMISMMRSGLIERR